MIIMDHAGLIRNIQDHSVLFIIMQDHDDTVQDHERGKVKLNRYVGCRMNLDWMVV